MFLVLEKIFSGFIKLKDSLSQIIADKREEIYSRTVNLLKIIYLNLFILILSLFFTLAGFIIIPFALISFAPWENQTKMFAGILIGLIYITAGFSVAYWMFEKTRWHKIFRKK